MYIYYLTILEVCCIGTFQYVFDVNNEEGTVPNKF